MERTVKLAWAAFFLALTTAGCGTQAAPAAGDAPAFDEDGRLRFPADYREWVYVSSGLDMTYEGEEGGANQDRPPMFTNVFVNPAGYRAFMETGAWPNGTTFVLEVRESASEGSINKDGRFQTGLAAIEAEVKDQARFPKGWGFFAFGRDTEPAEAIATTQDCYSCHSEHAALDHTFIQFYPTLLDAARKKGVLADAP
jgi:hypothetical protein